MSTSMDNFDPLAVVVDWLDACRLGKLDALLDLSDERATAQLRARQPAGREAIAAYWAPKLERRIVSAFTLDNVILTDCGVLVDYRGYNGDAVRISLSLQSLGQNTSHKLRRRPAAQTNRSITRLDAPCCRFFALILRSDPPARSRHRRNDQCRASADKHHEPCNRRRRYVVPRRSETDAGAAYGSATESGAEPSAKMADQDC